jgi:hypothetical protein
MKKKNRIIGMHYTKDQLEKLRHYGLFPIAAELKIPTRPDGKYGSKKEMIPKILKAQELHSERMIPYCEMCGQYSILREKSHICSEGDKSRENILMLCVSCHRMLDVLLKPRLYVALKRFGANRLPTSWNKSIYL